VKLDLSQANSIEPHRPVNVCFGQHVAQKNYRPALLSEVDSKNQFVRRVGERYGVLVLVHSFAMTIGKVVAFSGWLGLVRYGVEELDVGDRGRLQRPAASSRQGLILGRR
jgi:hypothetical protein